MSLIVYKLSKDYGNYKVVKSVSLNIRQGEVVGLLGPNGAGKTTTFYIIFGLLKPDFGKIYLNNVNITRYSPYSRSLHGVGYLPQEISIFKSLTVKENIIIVIESLSHSKLLKRNLKANKILDELGILKLANVPARLLSGGEKRRLEIARTLVIDPKIILLDEPFAGIDPLAIIDITNIIKQLKDRKIGILISDHNVKETLGVCDRAFILNEGKILVSGSPNKIINNKIAKKLYLGDKFVF